MKSQQTSHTNISKIVTSGDGFACNHIWPMWPHILQITTVDTDVISLGKIGAGNEYIFNSIIEYLNNNQADLIIVQWASSYRLDLVIDNDLKQKITTTDEVYKDNIFSTGELQWWLSSASKIQYVQDYHLNYIGHTQHQRRTINYIISLQEILKQKNIPYLFFSSYELDFLNDPLSKQIDWSTWVDQKGMELYSLQKRFKDIRLNQIQPSPPVHLEYVLEILKPHLSYSWNYKHINILKTLFQNQDWHGLVPHYISRSY